MKAFPHLFAKLFCQPVLVTEPVRFALENALLSRMGIVTAATSADPQFRMADPAAPSDPQRSYGDHGQPMEDYLQFTRDLKATREILRIENVYSRYDNVGVVKVDGVIDKALSQFEMDCFGGYDLNDFDSALAIAAADPRVDTVVLAINSPGGSSSGVAESAARVAALSKSKEVHAFVDCQACSAAYWIAAQADHLAGAPSAYFGSIGVYTAILDESRAMEMEGYKMELIKAGKFKAMGASFKPMTSEERQMIQDRVDSLHADFKAAVKSGRRASTEAGGHQTVADSVMEGQAFDGKSSLANRLIDELTGQTLDQYVEALIR